MNISEHNKLEDNSSPLAEQPNSVVPLINTQRIFGVNDLIHRWQPTGFRVVVNLPFQGNDQDYLFMIRPHPFIPYPGDFGKTDKDRDYDLALWNAFRPVIHGAVSTPSILKSPISISQHSPPPILSTMATAYRYWRGSLKYRIRSVSNFTTQGYLFYTLLRNTSDEPGLYNPFGVQPPVNRSDTSYLPEMTNSFISLDLSQSRHAELQVPFEYPMPYKDTYEDMYKALSMPSKNSHLTIPTGRNLIAFGLRGAITSQSTTSQAIFEIEYCAGEDFQFSGENLLGSKFSKSQISFLQTKDPYGSDVAKRSPFIVPQILGSDGRSWFSVKEPAKIQSVPIKATPMREEEGSTTGGKIEAPDLSERSGNPDPVQAIPSKGTK